MRLETLEASVPDVARDITSEAVPGLARRRGERDEHVAEEHGQAVRRLVR